MEPTIEIEIDGLLADYGQVFLTMESEKIGRNLSKMSPLQEYIMNKRKENEPLVVALASLSDYIVFYEESDQFGTRMYFMPFYTPKNVTHEVLQDMQLISAFNRLATNIRFEEYFYYDVQFVSRFGTVIRLHRDQMN